MSPVPPALLTPAEAATASASLRRVSGLNVRVARTGKVFVDLLGITRPRFAESAERTEAFARETPNPLERRLAEGLASTLRAFR